jgi:hypothetical protein
MTQTPTTEDEWEYYMGTDFENTPVSLMKTDWGDEFYWDKGTKQWTKNTTEFSFITRDDTELITEEQANELIASWS